MNRVYFISTNYLKSHTTINNNVDDNLLNSAIYEGQSIHIQQVLGTDLYKKLMDLVATGGISLAANTKYKTLLNDYVMDATCYWAFYESLPYIRFKVMNKGVENQYSDYSNPTEISQLEYLQENIRDKAEFYTQRLADFLLEHRTNYPEYNRNYELDKMQPSHQSYFCGMQFDEGGCGCERTMGYNHNAINIL